MSVIAAILAVLVAAVVLFVVSAPVRAARGDAAGRGSSPENGGDRAARADGAAADADRVDLEVERDAKYREIRDAELDYRTGKLSEADFNSIDAQLRAEALGILNELEALGEPAGDADTPG